MAIELQDFFNLTHYEYGEAYFGSCKGMRYRLAREPLENVHFTPPEKREPATLMATVWPEPYAYGMTEDSLKTSEHFEISQEGLEAAVAWIRQQYESRSAEWSEERSILD
jgi:hypothetical protein